MQGEYFLINSFSFQYLLAGELWTLLANFLLLKFASSIVRDPSTLKDAFFTHIQAVYNHLLNVQVGSVRFNLFSYSGLSSTVRN